MSDSPCSSCNGSGELYESAAPDAKCEQCAHCGGTGVERRCDICNELVEPGYETLGLIGVCVCASCLLDEIWAPWPTHNLRFSEIYSASNYGRGRSEPRTVVRSNGSPLTVRERILRPGLNSRGYPTVVMCDGAGQLSVTVHRAVCIAFHGAPKPGQQVDHRDSRRVNNLATNLRWASPRENTHFAIQAWYDSGGRVGINNRGVGNGQHKLTEAEVYEIRALAAAGELSHRKIAALFGIALSVVSNIHTRQAWAHLPEKAA